MRCRKWWEPEGRTGPIMKYVFVLLLILNTQCVCVCVAMVHSYLSKKISFQFSDSLSLEKKNHFGVNVISMRFGLWLTTPLFQTCSYML